jgi:hypothetical protein
MKLRYRSLTIRRHLRKLPYSKINWPFTPITAGVVFQAERKPPIARLAAEPLYEDRYDNLFTLGGKGSSPFDLEWP